MRILVISDTHIPTIAKNIPPIIEKEAKDSNLCIHSGDWVTYSTFKSINSLIKTYGVYGNMDDNSIKEKLPSKQTISLENITLGLTHGRGNPAKLLECIDKEFSENFENIDIFVFGHSHIPFDKEINGKIYFNPGSITDTAFAPYRSYGILEINGKNIKRRIVKIG